MTYYYHIILYIGPRDHDDILYILVSIIYKVYSIFERYSVLKLLLDLITYIFLIVLPFVQTAHIFLISLSISTSPYLFLFLSPSACLVKNSIVHSYSFL